MSSPVLPKTPKEADTISSDDKKKENCCDIEIYNARKEPSVSTSSLASSINSEEIKLSEDISSRKIKCSTKGFSKYNYKAPASERRGKSVPRQKAIKSSSDINKHYENLDSFEGTPKSSIEHLPRDYNEIRYVGNVNTQDSFVCSLYITSYNAVEEQFKMDVGMEPCANALNNIASGKIRIQKTCCGMMLAFTKEDDAVRFMKLPLQKVFGSPVQVVKFDSGEFKFRRNVIIKDVPWCISNLDIYLALKQQGITPGRITRMKSNVKIEILKALDVQQLLEEGLNFFGCTSFTVVVESTATQTEPDIIQCYKCQGFWHTSTHCRQMARCVRCGDNHDVEYCPRPRNSPICCHCGGPHHAAYRNCPVRLQHIKSTYLGFQLDRTKPAGQFSNNVN